MSGDQGSGLLYFTLAALFNFVIIGFALHGAEQRIKKLEEDVLVLKRQIKLLTGGL